MDKNLQLAKEVLDKVQVKLSKNEYKDIKLILSSYFKLIKVSIHNTLTSKKELQFFIDFKPIIEDYYKQAQNLLEAELRLNKFQEVNALTYIIDDLARAKREIIDHLKWNNRVKNLPQNRQEYTTGDYDINKGRPIE